MAIEQIKLTYDDQKKLEELGTDFKSLDDELARAKRAGIDVDDLREKLNAAKTLREGVLREYGR